ncbi:MAG TPA: RDD family protein [Terriglobia bacterium]|jgi:uncharacterized RDD family membrane protein YckC|nr:RDD family protein [Terriglobia bacterium]
MADHLIIETPEQISLDLPLAGIGSRFLALALDTLIQLGAASVIVAVWFSLSALGIVGGPASKGRLWFSVLTVVAAFLLYYGYFGFFEAIWNGQTPGKRYTHLRVVKNNGQPISVYDSVTRNLVRIVDSVPGIYVIGILAALLSSQSRRLGDYVAGTVVIRELPVERPAQPGAATEPAGEKPGNVVSVYAAGLSDEEFQLIEAFLLRRNQLSGAVRSSIAGQITAQIATRLGIPREEQRRPEDLLERLAAAYRARARFR